MLRLIETRVVFELLLVEVVMKLVIRLIETIVVFEYDVDGEEGKIFEINRNNSCIWMDKKWKEVLGYLGLIETRVVFESLIVI